MEDQASNQLWKKSDGQGHRLRRPHDNGSSVTPNGPAKEVNNAVNKAAGSRLSADAKEFFPAGYSSAAAGSKGSVQDRLLKIKHNQPQNQNDVSNAYPDGSQIEQDKRRLENMITTLIFNPGQFDNLLELFVETLKPYLDNHDMMNVMAEMLVFEVIASLLLPLQLQYTCLFLQSTKVPNFSYTGARLCKVIEELSPFFRATLHLICKKELESKQNLQGLTIFLGELYSQLHYENVYGKSLLCAMQTLLETGDDSSVKCVCQVLKVRL